MEYLETEKSKRNQSKQGSSATRSEARILQRFFVGKGEKDGAMTSGARLSLSSVLKPLITLHTRPESVGQGHEPQKNQTIPGG
jgi:hypothetical protein